MAHDSINGESASARIVVLGGGTGGTLAANRLRRSLGASARVTVVDQGDRHVYQPGLLFVPFGHRRAAELTRPRADQLRGGIEFVQSRVDRVDLPARMVHLATHPPIGYDVLVIATGAVLVPDETEGLAAALAAGKDVHTFYSLDGAQALARRLDAFDGGHVIVNIVDLPIKCPVAPLEFCFLADSYFRHRGIRDRVRLTYATPLDAAFTKPVAAKELAGLLQRKDIELVTDFSTGTVDGSRNTLTSFDGRELRFDLAVVVPLHNGADFVTDSAGLGDELGFVTVDPHTLQSTVDERVFAIGDAAALPASKAGSVAHFEGEVLVENIRRLLAGEPLTARFDGHTNCFVETGAGKALLIDFNYDTEPQPGRYPNSVGMPLLREARLNHLGKLLFQPLYWHVLLPGHDLPGLGSAMPVRGKRNSSPRAASSIGAGNTKG
ncbi:MAG TPA: FAD/NAD(P)-binding oxidoreductase [Jatrophihabitantaceae bacterium]|jgi:sulfide:quinone oxidoreductase|nr:FAD/NAD(P)-binding oxidoreductase [Jatrophihabitantaceae bacterium]